MVFVVLGVILAPNAARSALAERDVPFDGRTILLSGVWSFVPDAFVETMDPSLAAVPATVPSSWDDLQLPDGRRGRDVRAGTYLLRVRLPESVSHRQETLALAFPYEMHAARLVVKSGGSRWEAESGHPSLTASGEVPLHRPVRLDFVADGPVDIFLHVSSHAESVRAGIRRTLALGRQSSVEHARRMLEWRDIFLTGALALAALYHAALALLRPRERAPLWFSALALIMAVRTVVFANFLELADPPLIGWLLSQLLVYGTISLPVIFTLRYLDALFPDLIDRRALIASDVVGTLLALAPFIVGVPCFVFASNGGQLYALVAIVVVTALLARHAWRTRDALATGALLGFLTLGLSAVRDMIMVRVGEESVYYAPYGLLGFMFIQALVVATQNEHARRHTEALLESISNFVPRGFLELLGREDVSTVRLGDAVERDLTVLFADIRGFTSMSERLGPSEIFGMLNEWFGRIGPHVPANHGFIDKYIGDAIMALFPRSASDAVRAAIAMQREIATVSVVLPTVSRIVLDASSVTDTMSVRRLAIGIGIHKGRTMLGTVGEGSRFEATVISDAVNLAARLEQATVMLGVRVLVSGEVVADLEPGLARRLRPLGAFQVKGRRKSLDLYEVLDADGDEAAALKLEHLDAFACAREALLAGETMGARERFGALVRAAPDDGAARFFLRVAEGEVAHVHGRVVVLSSKSGEATRSTHGALS